MGEWVRGGAACVRGGAVRVWGGAGWVRGGAGEQPSLISFYQILNEML